MIKMRSFAHFPLAQQDDEEARVRREKEELDAIESMPDASKHVSTAKIHPMVQQILVCRYIRSYLINADEPILLHIRFITSRQDAIWNYICGIMWPKMPFPELYDIFR
jgi:hypothetical protein